MKAHEVKIRDEGNVLLKGTPHDRRIRLLELELGSKVVNQTSLLAVGADFIYTG